MNNRVILIGAGSMAAEYAQVLKAQNCNFTVVGRGEESAIQFEKVTGIKVILGGIENYIATNVFEDGTRIIIATGTQDLMKVLLIVLMAGASSVLVEKPAAISIDELLGNEERLKPYANKVFVAYNRRFYASVFEAQKLIEEDGGLQSLHFEFTEWAHKIEPVQKAPGVKENWFFANSTHVVDLAFYFAGKPVDWQTYSKRGKLSWHNPSRFAGAGITEHNVLFSYMSNWESAGRWGIELLTEKRRIYLKPLESIAIQTKGTISLLEHFIDDSLDKRYKPGLFKQVEEFLIGPIKRLPDIKQHMANTRDLFARMIV